jgi:thioredoxin 1
MPSASLPPDLSRNMIKQITDATFAEATRNGVVLVDFWAPWCQPCKAMLPVLEAIASARADALSVCKLNVDENPSAAMTWGIRNLPTVLVMRDGQPAGAISGAHSRAAFEQQLDTILAK